jgi:cholesterol transport system auxiliary component
MTPAVRIAAVSLATLALSACALLGGGEKSTLYRFGQATNAELPPAAAPGQVAVFKAGGLFQREAAGDRILTVTDGKVAYIAATRWVTTASGLWDQALTAAFDAHQGRVRLLGRGEPGSAEYILRTDVRNFEAHYDRGPKAGPTVLVRVRAAITRGTGGAAGERIFEARVPAADNRVTAIVAAYDRAVRDVLAELTPWVNEQAVPIPRT